MMNKKQGWLTILAMLAMACGSTRLKAQQAAPPETKPFNPATVDYTHSESFPNFLAPYFAQAVPQPKMSNSELLHTLIQNGKLRLSVEDALALALQNNLSIDVGRYQLAYAQTDLLRTRAGGTSQGINPALLGAVTAFGGAAGAASSGGTGGAGGVTGGGGARNTGSVGCCDPVAGVSFGWDQNVTPLNSRVVTGVPTVGAQTTSVSTFFGKGWLTGTSVVVALSGIRQSTSSLFTLFDPYVASGLTVGFNQKLLNGFGYRANAKYIRIANNDVAQADSTFSQTVMTTVANVLNLYYDLLYYKQNVKVAQQALAYDQQLLSDNKKQVEIGTLAPLEIIRAESQVATDQQNLIVAETRYRQQEELLKTQLSRHVGPDLAAAGIDATDSLPVPSPDDIPALPQALQEAERKRPEIKQAEINIRNQNISLQASRNALLPTFDLFGTYSPTGLFGNRIINGVVVPGGLSESLSQALHNRFSDYSFGVTLSVPIRNRAGQAAMTTSLLQERQLETQLQQTRNTVEQDVRNAVIAVTQAKAQINAAQKATQLAQQTLEDERKKFQLGESTTLNVILTERDYTSAQGNEAQARDNYAKALVQFYQATGTTLDRFNIQLAEAKTGQRTRVPNIPGTPSAAPSNN